MSEKESGLDPRIKAGALIVSSGVVGAPVGAVVANSIFPTSIEYVPGVEAEVSLSLTKGAHLDTVLSEISAPNAPVVTHIPGVDGIHGTIKSFNPDKASDVASLVAKFNDTVVHPTSDAIRERLLTGAGVGSAAAMAATSLALLYVRRRHQDGAKETHYIETLRSDPAASKESLQVADDMETYTAERHRLRKLRQKVAVGAAALLFATTGLSGDSHDTPQTEPVSKTVALSTYITDHVPELTGATMTGLGGDLVNTAAYGAAEYIDGVDEFWQESGKTFLADFEALRRQGKLPELDNPNLVPIAFFSDLHCAYPYYQNLLPLLLNAYQPHIIANGGDTFTNSNTMPYETNCHSDFVQAIRNQDEVAGTDTEIIEVSGNHDEKDVKQEDTTILNKENGYTKTIDDITFVGDDDPTITIWAPTLPEDPKELDAVVAKQGSTIAKEACKIEEEQPETPVIVLSHEPQASFETIARGCASLVLNGHTHSFREVRSYAADNGNEVLQHTGGTATGADVGITIYQKPNKDATFTMFYFNRVTRQFVSRITTTVHTNGELIITRNKLPKNPTATTEDYKEVDDYLADNSKTYERP